MSDVWTQLGPTLGVGKLYHPKGVAMNGAGNIIAVRTYEDFNTYPSEFYKGERGRVFVYSWNGTAWLQMGQALEDSPSNSVAYMSAFGMLIGMNSAGDRVAVGVPYTQELDGSPRAAVKIYSWNGTSWQQLGGTVFTPVGGNLQELAFSRNGTAFAFLSTYLNKVYVYAWNGSSWVQRGGDIQWVPPYWGLGGRPALSISLDGNTIAVGLGSGTVQICGFKDGMWRSHDSSIIPTWDSSLPNNDGAAGYSVVLDDTGTIVATTVSVSGNLSCTKVHRIIYYPSNHWWGFEQIGNAILGNPTEIDRTASCSFLNRAGSRLALVEWRASTNRTTARILELQQAVWTGVVQLGTADLYAGGISALASGFAFNDTLDRLVSVRSISTVVPWDGANGTQVFQAPVTIPVITPGQTATGRLGSSFSFPVANTGGVVTSWSFAGALLPTGVTFNTSTGVFSGTPSSTGTFVPSVTATNSNGSSTQNVTITISDNAIVTCRAGAAQATIAVENGTSSTFYAFIATTISKVISGARNLIKRGTGNLTLSAANTYTGGTTLHSGALIVSNSSALGAGSCVVNAGAALQIQGGITLTVPITLNSVGIGNGGGIRNLSGNNTIASAINFGSATCRAVCASGTLTLSNGASGAASGANPAQFGAVASNTNLSITGGSLNFSGRQILIFGGIATNNVVFLSVPIIACTSLNINFGVTFRMGAENVLLSTAPLSFNTTATGGRTNRLDLNGFSQTVSSLSSTNDANEVATITSATAVTFTISGTTNGTYGGTITGAVALTKAGSSTITLNGANTYTGTTTVTAGSLVFTKIVSGPAKVSQVTLTSIALTVTFSTAPLTGETYQLFGGATSPTTLSITLNNAGGKTGTYNFATSTLTIN